MLAFDFRQERFSAHVLAQICLTWNPTRASFRPEGKTVHTSFADGVPEEPRAWFLSHPLQNEGARPMC